MKKLISLLLALMLLGCTAALAESETFGGVWYLSYLVSDGEQINAADMGMNLTLVFSDDLSSAAFTSSFMGEESTSNFTCAVEGDTITLTGAEEDVLTATVEDGLLMLDDESTRMVFTREAPAATVVETVAVESAEAFYGEWDTVSLTMMGLAVSPEEAGVAPHFSISAEGITMTDGEEVETMPYTFENGMLTVVAKVSDDTAEEAVEGLDIPVGEEFTTTVEMLVDGNLYVKMDFLGVPFAIVMAPAAAVDTAE